MERRGIQALFLPRFGSGFIKEIAEKMAMEPKGRTLEFAFSTHTGSASSAWSKAKTMITALPGRNVNMVVHLGHHVYDDQKTLEEWGKSFFDKVLKPYRDEARVSFFLSLSNEDRLTGEWSPRMKELLGAVVKKWQGDPLTKDRDFPTNRVFGRRCRERASVQSSKLKVGKIEFTIDSEYHFPASASLKTIKDARSRDYGVFSNDGWAVYDDSAEPSDLAYAKDKSGDWKALPKMTLGDFDRDWSGKSLLFWHPAFHMWPTASRDGGGYKKDRFYYKDVDERKPVSGAPKRRLLSALETFMKAD